MTVITYLAKEMTPIPGGGPILEQWHTPLDEIFQVDHPTWPVPFETANIRSAVDVNGDPVLPYMLLIARSNFHELTVGNSNLFAMPDIALQTQPLSTIGASVRATMYTAIETFGGPNMNGLNVGSLYSELLDLIVQAIEPGYPLTRFGLSN